MSALMFFGSLVELNIRILQTWVLGKLRYICQVSYQSPKKYFSPQIRPPDGRLRLPQSDWAVSLIFSLGRSVYVDDVSDG